MTIYKGSELWKGHPELTGGDSAELPHNPPMSMTREEQPRPTRHSGSGEPPHNDGMEARVVKLEEFARDTRDRLTRIETRMDSLATKEELTKLRGETKEGFASVRADIASSKADTATALAGVQREIAGVHKEISSSVRWFVGWATGVGTVLVAAAYFIAKNVR